jgi:hypothetical protein
VLVTHASAQGMTAAIEVSALCCAAVQLTTVPQPFSRTSIDVYQTCSNSMSTIHAALFNVLFKPSTTQQQNHTQPKAKTMLLLLPQRPLHTISPQSCDHSTSTAITLMQQLSSWMPAQVTSRRSGAACQPQ